MWEQQASHLKHKELMLRHCEANKLSYNLAMHHDLKRAFTA